MDEDERRALEARIAALEAAVQVMNGNIQVVAGNGAALKVHAEAISAGLGELAELNKRKGRGGRAGD
jgi:hypothetical protein